MKIQRLLVANRGEIAIRVMRAAAELGIRSVAVYGEDDARSLHVRRADESRPLAGSGVPAYLDIDQLVSVAREAGCDAIHPGYGFLSERAAFARACADAGITFVGPTPETLLLFGDKTAARALAERVGVPVLSGTSHATSFEEARRFLASLPAGKGMLLKAVAGGGGRGMRLVTDGDELPAAYERCRSEAKAAFGSGDLYVEALVARARHIEVQVAGDGSGEVVHLWERECSLQRRHQKLVEVAPAPGLDPVLRHELTEAALRLAREARYRSLGTVEFLVDLEAPASFAFIETNARLQVEHTVTEAVTGIDLVQAQLRLAGGSSLTDVGLTAELPEPFGFAVQVRVNMETLDDEGTPRPTGGTLTAFEPASGLGVRTDTFGYSGYTTSPHYDSLLAKVIGHASGEFTDALTRTDRALAEMRVEGVATNIPLLQALLQHPDVRAGELYTRFLDDHLGELLAAQKEAHRRLFFEEQVPDSAGRGLAGARVDTTDPLAVLAYGKSGDAGAAQTAPAPAVAAPPPLVAGPPGTIPVNSPMQGTIVSLLVAEGDRVRRGQDLLVMEAMKMEHVIAADRSGYVRLLTVRVGDTVFEQHPLAFLEEAEVQDDALAENEEIDLDAVRPDLAEVLDRHAVTLDAARPDAVAKRRKTGQRTARENIEDLCDSGTFREHGGLVLTPGTGLPLEEVIPRFPTDGMVTGIGSINGDHFNAETARCVVMSYDYTVLAGTQGAVNHPKTDRMLELAEKWLRPVVFFAEGGGGRAGTGGRRAGGRPVSSRGDAFGGRPLDTPTFASMGRLSGLVPLIGITSGRCFAGNASLLGCCDVIIATANSNIGMGGPALVEGGNLGVFTPEEIGPMEVQVPNGTVDIAVEDEAEAVAVARKYLSYFQGPIDTWECADQRLLRRIVPENRLRIYDIREVIETLSDTGAVLELRPKFGLGMVTAFIRIEGEPIGVLANNPSHLAGAIDSDGSDKAARFLQLCDAFDIPILVLCDTPGMMVGPEIEKTALVRHCSRLFVIGANLTVAHMTIVLRKAYGLGAQAMAGGSFKEPMFAVAWPTGEFGGMGLEGQVKLGFRNELAAIDDPKARAARYDELVAAAYKAGRAINSGVAFGVDDVIDPADSRRWILDGLHSRPRPIRRHGKKRRNVDTW